MASVAAAPALFAATSSGNAQNAGQETGQMGPMMHGQGHSQMGGRLGMKHDGQMPMMKMMRQMNGMKGQMSEMMATCNQMMQT